MDNRKRELKKEEKIKKEKEFWDKYKEALKDGYFKEITDKNDTDKSNKKKYLKAEYIVDYPQEIAIMLEDYNKNKLSQLWKFYDHAKRVQDMLHQNSEPLEALWAELCVLKPTVAYAEERAAVTQQFVKFINLNINCIKNKEDLNAFVKHFQSLIAYLPRRNQR